jgi:hypothetical protein
MEPWEHLQPVIDRLIAPVLDRGLDAVTPTERDLFLAWSYATAIPGDGHVGFFVNPGGEYAHETVQALHTAGAPEFAAVLSRAIDLFPDRYVPRDIDERNEVWDTLCNSLGDELDTAMDGLDDEFHALDERHELIAKLLQFWNDHAA